MAENYGEKCVVADLDLWNLILMNHTLVGFNCICCTDNIAAVHVLMMWYFFADLIDLDCLMLQWGVRRNIHLKPHKVIYCKK